MKKRFVLFLIFSVVCSFSFAQVKLAKKTRLSPALANHHIEQPHFAQNTKTGDTLIVWFDSPSSSATDDHNPIMGRVINGKGKPVGKPFTIVAAPHITQNPFNLPNFFDSFVVAYNPALNEYLLVYNEGYFFPIDGVNQPIFKVFTLRLTAAGHPKGQALDITSSDPALAPFDNIPASLEFIPKTGGYLLIENFLGDLRDPPFGWDEFALLKRDGTLDGSFHKIDQFDGGPLPIFRVVQVPIDFAFPISGKFLMVSILDGINHTKTPFDYGVISADFQKLKTLKPTDLTKLEPKALTTGANQGLTGLSFPSADSAVAYFVDKQNIKGRKISLDGKLLGKPFNAFNAPADPTLIFFPSVAFATTSKGSLGLLIAREDDRQASPNTLWAQLLDANGKPNGSSVKLFTTADTERFLDAKLVALPGKPGNKTARFIWYGLLEKSVDGNFNGDVNLFEKLDISIPLP